MSILFRTFVVEKLSNNNQNLKSMTYKKAKKIQGIIFDLDAMNEVSRIACATEHDVESDEWYCVIFARENIAAYNYRAEKVAHIIWLMLDNIFKKKCKYNAGTSKVKWVRAWQLF